MMNLTGAGNETLPVSPQRLRAFANFFKGYMSIAALVTAALPIPVTAFKLIPTYQFQTKLLATLTSLFCFLILAFVFYSRHKLARSMFAEYFHNRSLFWVAERIMVSLLPLLLVISSLIFIFLYLSTLTSSVSAHRQAWDLTPQITDSAILEVSYQSQVPKASVLMIYYLAFFLSAEGAFTLMALKEYLQDLLQLNDRSVISGPPIRGIESVSELKTPSPG